MSDVRYSCCSCQSGNMDVLVDLGMNPVSNRFLKDPHAAEKYFNLTLCQCRDCALIQLAEYIPCEYVKPTYSWISYLEPEAHLDNLAIRVAGLSVVRKGAKVLGLSYKDKSFIERLNMHGYEGGVLNIPGLSLESVRDSLSNCLDPIIKKYGKVDLLVARHILEHSYDLNGFIRSLKGLVNLAGYVLIEVPDFKKSLHNLDYPAIWEEHTAYFTEHTLRRAFAEHDFTIELLTNYPYPMENCLVLIASNSAGKSGHGTAKNDETKDVNNNEIRSELELGKRFKESFAYVKDGIKDFLCRSSATGVAIMGAGHLGCAFVNYFGLGEQVKYFIDDNPNKKGLYTPGSKLGILDSSVLKNPAGPGVDTILLSINPRNEEKCIKSNQQFICRGGKFYSIFKNSSMPLPVFLTASDLHLMKKSDEVYYAVDETVRLSQSHIDFLKANLRHSKNGRIRICAHKSPGDVIHEMLIVFDGKSYIRPHKHVGKTESFHILEGSVDVVLFSEEGNMVEVIKLGAPGLGLASFYRLNKPQFHTVLINSDQAVIMETTQGSFNKEDSVFAPWSPREDDMAVNKYIEDLKKMGKVN
ncbi:MAG: WbuC family cupin fold metalloprotein [bacterium]